MKLWVGLGNPGPEHAGNRHNIGFMAVDRIAADHGFGPWRKAFHGLVAEGRLGAGRMLLLKPLTFMNLSGQSVRAAVDYYRLPVEAVRQPVEFSGFNADDAAGFFEVIHARGV